MMQSQPFLPSWQTFNYTCSSAFNQTTLFDQQMDGFCELDEVDFSCFDSPEDSSVISSNTHVPTMFADEFLDLENLGDDQIQICSDMEGFDNISSGVIENIYDMMIIGDNSEESFSPPITISQESDHNSIDMSLMLPGVNMERDDHLSLLHLLRAYGEAMENGEKELADVVVKSINDKSSPLGNTMERVAYHLFQSRENEGEYLRQESSKNHVSAFKVLYQSLPNGRFAHFTSNSAILESMPNDVSVLEVVDFDMGDGIQWPPLIEAMSGKRKALRITSIKSEDECMSSCWGFEDTKRMLLAHARRFGVKLQIEEKGIENLGNELMSMKNRGWVVFNCMVGLPYMGRRRSRKSVDEFLKVAKELLVDFEGIVTFGDGEAGEISGSCYGYASYFDGLLRHYQAVFESLESNFPVYLAEARTAMESLFLAPFMCPLAWAKDWEEMITKSCDFQAETRLKGRKVSQENLAEAKQMVIERENSYQVRVERLRENEMVLQWKEIPLVRVSTWKS